MVGAASRFQAVKPHCHRNYTTYSIGTYWDSSELVRCSAEAPNINFAKEVYDLDLMANTIRAIFLVPRMARPLSDSGTV